VRKLLTGLARSHAPHPTRSSVAWTEGFLITHLRLDQHKVDEQYHEVMLDVFVGELLAVGALRQTHAFPK